MGGGGGGGGGVSRKFKPCNAKVVVCFYWFYNYFPILILGNSIGVLGFTYNNTRIWRFISVQTLYVHNGR